MQDAVVEQLMKSNNLILSLYLLVATYDKYNNIKTLTYSDFSIQSIRPPIRDICVNNISYLMNFYKTNKQGYFWAITLSLNSEKIKCLDVI